MLRMAAVPVFCQLHEHVRGKGSLKCGGQRTGGAGSALQQRIEQHLDAQTCCTALRPADS